MFPRSPSLVETMTTGPWSLFDLLSEFWKHRLSDTELLRIHNFAKLMLGEDALLRMEDLYNAASVQDVQPYLSRQWWSLELLESGLSVDPNVITYGSGREYGGGSVYAQTDAMSFAWSIPAQIKSVGLIVDRILDPTAVWGLGSVDFVPDRSILRFRTNPFDVVESRLVYNPDGSPSLYTNRDGTQHQDRSLRLWLRNVEFDENTPFLRYGSIAGLPSSGSTAYPDVVEATWSMIVNGPSLDALRRGAFATTGLAYTEGDEVVERVDTDNEGRVVVTSKNVYRGHPNAGVVVGVGDPLTPGQAVFDTVEVVDLASPEAVSSALQGIALTPALSDLGGVVVPAETTQWQWEGVVDGYPKARFELVGSEEDIEAFWDAVHARGVEEGKTLAQYVPGLSSIGQPDVNPLEFFVKNVFGSNIILLLVRPQHFLVSEPWFLQRIGSLVPAGVLVLTQIALEPVSDSIGLDTAGESVTAYPAVSAAADTIALGASPGDPGLADYYPQVWNA